MTQADFWRSPAIVERYAQMEAGELGWYERDVNGPSVMSLIPSASERILDFGCGPGFFTTDLAERFNEVEGCDTSEPMLAVARTGNPTIDFYNWDFRTSPPPRRKYDAVVCKQVVEYVDDLPVFASAMHTILTAAGSLVLSLQHPSATADFVSDYWQTTQYKTPVSDYGIYPSLIHRSQNEVFEPFINAGFLLQRCVEPKPEAGQNYTARPIRLNVAFTKATPAVPHPRVGGPTLQQRLGR